MRACCFHRVAGVGTRRDAALDFYLRHGFVVDGDGFIDEHTAKPHHLIHRRLP